jgi:hypothetical protein
MPMLETECTVGKYQFSIAFAEPRPDEEEQRIEALTRWLLEEFKRMEEEPHVEARIAG